VLLLALSIAQTALLSINMTRPWVGHHDWNNAQWALAARANLRAGLRSTLGVPVTHYAGPPPIPADGYYVHHPTGVPLAVTAMVALFGEHEWSVRLLAIACSLLTMLLLARLVWSCAGPRAALLAALTLLLLPMELYYGRMVNHEVCGLLWMIAALVCLRVAQLEDQPRWWAAMLGCFLAGLWTGWIVYILTGMVATLLLITQPGRQKTVGLALVGLAAVSVAIFLIQIRSVNPDAWRNLLDSLLVRAIPRGNTYFTWGQWLGKQSRTLSRAIPLPAWGLSVMGAIQVIRRGRENPGLRWLGWAAAAVALTNAMYVLVLRQGSYTHDYLGFHFVAPVAMLAGVALDGILAWPRHRVLGILTVLALTAWLGARAYTTTRELHRFQYHILDYTVDEPPDLIPALGRTIAQQFPEDTQVVCNFLPWREPQVLYYASRNLIGGQNTFAQWQPLLAQPDRPVGGVIWMQAPGANELVSALPGGAKRIVEFGNLRFCFWRPTPPADPVHDGTGKSHASSLARSTFSASK
jgi:4-amino-4-deoxy-L-arabinose transferase-like glycosyltransferase